MELLGVVLDNVVAGLTGDARVVRVGHWDWSLVVFGSIGSLGGSLGTLVCVVGYHGVSRWGHWDGSLVVFGWICSGRGALGTR